MSALLVVAMAAVAVWLVLLTLRRGSRGYSDATGDFSRALAAIAPRRGARRRRR